MKSPSSWRSASAACGPGKQAESPHPLEIVHSTSWPSRADIRPFRNGERRWLEAFWGRSRLKGGAGRVLKARWRELFDSNHPLTTGGFWKAGWLTGCRNWPTAASRSICSGA